MASEKDKMLAGELYDPLDPELVAARNRARDLCQDLNATREADQDARRQGVFVAAHDDMGRAVDALAQMQHVASGGAYDASKLPASRRGDW